MSARQYYDVTDIDVGKIGQTTIVCPLIFRKRGQNIWQNFQT